MIKQDLKNPLVIIVIVSAFLLTIMFIKYYFINPIFDESEKIEISEQESEELKILTMAYLNQNQDLEISRFFKTKANLNKYNVAAEYYYLKNGQDFDYEVILDLAKSMFSDKNVKFTNFTIAIDEDKCGKINYTTLDGIVYKDSCNLDALIYEVIDTYRENDDYVVEFYAAKASQVEEEKKDKCANFETPLSYKLVLTDLYSNEFYNETYAKCCNYNCILEGVFPIKAEILSHIKQKGDIYKMVFEKNGNDFNYYKISKK